MVTDHRAAIEALERLLQFTLAAEGYSEPHKQKYDAADFRRAGLEARERQARLSVELAGVFADLQAAGFEIPEAWRQNRLFGKCRIVRSGRVGEPIVNRIVDDSVDIRAVRNLRAEVCAALVELRKAPKQDGPWSEADTPTRWATKFRVKAATFKRWAKAGKIRVKKLSDRSYLVHLDDLPQAKQGPSK